MTKRQEEIPMEDMAGVNRRVIQWFPGHMAKTLRMMEKEIRNVDCV